MPRYHFNVHDGQDYPDHEGSELPDLEAARAEALRYMSDLLTEQGGSFWTEKSWRMEVTDRTGLTLFRIDFAANDAPSVSEKSRPYLPLSGA